MVSPDGVITAGSMLLKVLFNFSDFSIGSSKGSSVSFVFFLKYCDVSLCISKFVVSSIKFNCGLMDLNLLFMNLCSIVISQFEVFRALGGILLVSLSMVLNKFLIFLHSHSHLFSLNLAACSHGHQLRGANILVFNHFLDDWWHIVNYFPSWTSAESCHSWMNNFTNWA